MSPRRLAWLLVLACLAASAARAEEVIAPALESPAVSSAPAPAAPLDAPEPDENLAPLRRWHEGAYFLLKRYAMMEALIGASEQGRPENTAFAVGAASVIPGVGQLINHDGVQGGLLLTASGLSALTIRRLEFSRRQRPGAGDLVPLYYGCLAARNGLMAYAMLQAANVSYRNRRDRTAALWTGTASLLPGVGQAVNGQWWEAAGFLLLYTGSALLTAHVEEAIFPSGDDRSYQVRDPSDWTCQLACLPDGAALSITKTW